MKDEATLDALAAAIRAGDSARLRALLESEPALRLRIDEAVPGDAFGATLLLLALQRRDLALVDLLLDAGANINQRSHWWAGGFGVLDDDQGMAEELIARGAVVDVNAASHLGMIDRLRELLGTDAALVHARGGDGQTPLHMASTVDIAELLLKHGADIDALDVDHESTPAQYMIRDRQEIAHRLVDRGCRTDILMAAALGDAVRVRRHLEESPSSIRANASTEFFPMRNPRAGGPIYFWTLGAEMSVHQVARDFGHEEILELLLAASPPPLRLVRACEVGDEKSARVVKAEHSDVTSQLTAGDARRLPTAARNGNADGVRLMLAAGWPVDAPGQHGGSALHWAAWRGDSAMVREILRHRPALELCDRDFGGTPLGWAMHQSTQGSSPGPGDYVGTIEALLLAGAKKPAPG